MVAREGGVNAAGVQGVRRGWGDRWGSPSAHRHPTNVRTLRARHELLGFAFGSPPAYEALGSPPAYEAFGSPPAFYDDCFVNHRFESS
jgi:hypothetical protein